jgi:DNA-binding NarL/FixJ family response regulator
MAEKPQRKVKVLIAEDEEFIRNLVANSLDKSGYETCKVGNVSDALAAMETFDPHVIISDLDFGPGPDGADLLTKVNQDKPWTGMIVLTAHASPELAVHGKSRIPKSAIYLVKSRLDSVENLLSAIEESIIKSTPELNEAAASEGKIVLSTSQCEILRMMADGLSNAAIAEERGITLRAAEALIQRTFQALGIKSDPKVNSRVVAVRMWQQGKVVLG